MPPIRLLRASIAATLAASLLIAPPACAWPPMHLWRLASPANQPHRPTPSQPREVFPHVRLDRDAGLVELDGAIPINAHAQDGSVVFLEAIACRPDTKEHESLVVTSALASHVHAALLLLGLEPGAPGRWEWNDRTLSAVPPTGSALAITIAWIDDAGRTHEHTATDLIENRADGRTFTAAMRPENSGLPLFVFAGSRFVQHQGRELYDADGTGLIVGLHTFGSETIAPTVVLNHEASVQEPEWIASRALLPPRGTPVTVRIRPLPSAQPPAADPAAPRP